MQDIFEPFFEQQAINNFIDANQSFKPELLTTFYKTYKAMRAYPELQNAFNIAFSEYDPSAPSVELNDGGAIVRVNFDIFDRMFRIYEERGLSGQPTHPLFLAHYDITEKEWQLQLKMTAVLHEHIHLPSFDFYQAIHDAVPELKHFVKRGSWEEDGIEFYRVILKDGTKIDMYAGNMEAVREWNESNYFAE